jgi:hypothetical protein
VAGVLVLYLGYAVSGLALLTGAGLVRRFSEAVRWLGLALVAGWAGTGIWLSLVLVAGFDVTVASVVGGWGVAVLVGLGLTRVVAAAPPREPSRRTGRPAGAAAAAVAASAGLVALMLALGLARALYWHGRFHGDVWSFWIPKAEIIYFFDGLDTAAGGFTSQVSPDYPPLKPALDAAVFEFAGAADPLLLPVHNMLVGTAFVAAAVAILARVVPLWVAAAGGALVVALPEFSDLLGSCLADESLAVEFALAALLVSCWLVRPDGRWLALAALFLTGCVLTKNEGAMLGLTLVGVAMLVSPGRRSAALLAGVPGLLAFGLWKGWLIAHDVPPNPAQRFSKLLDPGYLAGAADQLAYGAYRLVENVAAKPGWLLAVPLGMAAASALVRRCRPLALLALLVPVLALSGFAVIYWIGPDRIFPFEPPHKFVDDNVGRVVAPVALSSAAVLPLLLSELGLAAGGRLIGRSAQPPRD